MKRTPQSVLTIVALVVLLASVGLGCANSTTSTQEGTGVWEGNTLKSTKSRITDPNVDQSKISELVAGNTQFALELYQQLKKEQSGNLFFSPYSISLALAMTYAGARNETEEQMRETLHFTLQERL